jgi:hypothetical protein
VTSSRSSSGASAIRLALLLWGGLLLVLVPLRSPGDGDLYWQRWLGELILQTHRLPSALGSETFTSAGAPWVPQEWLFSTAVALAMNHHLFRLLSVIVSVVPVAILALIWLRSRRSSSPEAIAIVLLFSGMALSESLGIRAQVLGWGALAAFMLFLERNDRWYYAAFPTAIVWANLHASVAIAPVIVLARIAATVADGGFRALRTSRDAYTLPAVLLAIFCTPLGWRLPFYAIALAHSPIRHFIMEWQPTGFRDLSFTFGALPLALAIVAGGKSTLWRSKLRSFPSVLLFAAMLFAGRNIALFAIVAAPLAAKGLDLRFPQLARLGVRVRELEAAAVATMCVAFVVSGLALTRIQQREPAPLPVAAIAALASDNSNHRLFCENFTWCSIALQYPSLRVFIDGRCDPYPLDVWRRYISTINVGRSWRETLDRYRVDEVLAQRRSGFALALSGSARWEPVFKDRSFIIFQRN